ncbi:GIY-YIG nuclease family protein [Acetobacterium wieringae]|uniref:GIY-YIG nuclease family protein n=1 Tax=Acetobacterium wieringae TaxID=52694 RepID=A0A5D0WHY7_9FIRM|nr:GIY-YIG nuclease family protein [Acetobacterium wieringae]TYC83614.1 GIY-YIG nuclease family protein [Acetobacterium wieringae]
METRSKKELKENYKNRRVVGGIYGIKCSGNDRIWIKSTPNMVGQQNRFGFAVATNSCPEPAMLEDWKAYGAKSFSFVVLEEIKKGETQSEAEFSDDIAILLEIWIDKQKEERINEHAITSH